MLHEKMQRSGSYLSVKHGAICLESKEPLPGYERITGEVAGVPYEKYVKKFSGVSGLLIGLEWYTREHDGNHFRGLQLTLKDGNEIYFLDLPFGKRPFDSFCLSAENIDLTQPVLLEAYYDTKRAKPNKPVPTGFIIKQNGRLVPWNYTKDNPGDCPKAKYNELTGTWNFDERRAWLLDRILKVVVPQIEELYGTEAIIADDDAGDEISASIRYASIDPSDADITQVSPGDDDDDDIPF